MVKITEEMVRRRAEHNEGEISTLEELSLHQQDIEKIQYLDKWCHNLRILYLQSNLIPKIENVGRLKQLIYLNLALNNIEKIENLEKCESLQKLDLTLNFIGELTSIQSLKDNYNLQELFLTGNPCTDYDGYREYVISVLCQLRSLDGKEISKSERIKALQLFQEVKLKIEEQQEKYREKQEEEKKTRLKKKLEELNNGEVKCSSENCSVEEEERRFWSKETEYTPEDRVEAHQHLEMLRRKGREKDKGEKPKERRLITSDGRVLNINEAKIPFSLFEDERENRFMLDISIYRYLDTSLLDVDIQPHFVRVYIKGRVFQLVLPEEVQPDSSNAQRSQTTGHLVITMPKVHGMVKPCKVENKNTCEPCQDMKQCFKKERSSTSEKLEVGMKNGKDMDFRNIVSQPLKSVPRLGFHQMTPITERPNSASFLDDPDVPPLE